MRLLSVFILLTALAAAGILAPAASAQCPGSALPNVGYGSTDYGQFGSQFSAGYGYGQFSNFSGYAHSVGLSDFRAVTFIDGFGRIRVRFEPVNRALFRTFGLFGDVHFLGIGAGHRFTAGQVVTVVDARGRRLAIRIR